MKDRSQMTIQKLIANHINAIAEHDRRSLLNDYGLVDDDALFAALAPIDDALFAICRARPTAPDDAELRRDYLAGNLAEYIDGSPELVKRAVMALIDEGATQ